MNQASQSNVNSTSLAQINTEDIKRFFNFLAPNENEIFSGWFCNESGDMPITDLGFVFESVPKLIKMAKLVYENEKGTMHICLNRTSQNGRSIKDIQSARVLCVDLDNPTERELIKEYVEKYSIQMVVESSPGKFHLYWKIDSALPLEVWKDIQGALAFAFSADTNLNQTGRTIRVPGIPRKTKDGQEFTPRVVWLDAAEDLDAISSKRHDFSSIQSLFPELNEWIQGAKDKEKKVRRADKQILKLKVGSKMTDKQAKVLGESRNRTIYNFVLAKCMAHFKAGNDPLSLEEAIILGTQCAEMFPQNGKPSLETREIEKTARSSWMNAEKNIAEARKEKEKIAQELQKSRAQVEFEYDYSDKELARNRFTENSIKVRALQRFANKLVRVNKVLYAFNEHSNLWVTQGDKDGEASELNEIAEIAIEDTINDDAIVKEVYTNSKGEICPKLIKAAQEKFGKLYLTGHVAGGIRRSHKVWAPQIDVFDENPYLIGLENGVYNFKTGEIRKPQAEDYILTRTRIEFDANAVCPGWIEFLIELFQENKNSAQMLNYLQELFGYSLTGLISTQKIFCHFGDGSNGKSKVLDTLRRLGGNYSGRLGPEDLVTKKGMNMKAMERIAANLERKRIILVDDAASNASWRQEILKNLTGTEMDGKLLYKENATFRNTGKTHLGVNILPASEGDNFGLRRRLQIIPYLRKFEPSESASNRIDAMIKAELAGIFNWAAIGAKRYIDQEGFSPVEDLEIATKEYNSTQFDVEEAVKFLYRRPKADEIVTPILAEEILREINTYAQENGDLGGRTANEVNRAVRSNFKVVAYNVRHPSKKYPIPAYKLLRNFTSNRKDKDNL